MNPRLMAAIVEILTMEDLTHLRDLCNIEIKARHARRPVQDAAPA